MGVTNVNNQAVKLYTPSETRFNEKTSKCEWHLDYFPLVTCDDITEILLDTNVETSDVEHGGDFSYEVTGSGTSQVLNKLVDAGADFVTSGVTTDMYARNVSNDISARITNIDSATTLSLDADIFADPAAPEYEITYFDLSGNMNIASNELVKTSGASGSMVQGDILTEDSLYKFEIDITSFSSTVDGAQINLKIGGTTVLTLDETDSVTGTHIVYGYASGASPTEIEITADSGVSATFDTLRVSQVSNVVFFVLDCEDDSVAYTSVVSDIQTSSLSAQIKLSFDWSNLQDGYTCKGCKYIVIIDDVGLPDNLNEDRINDGEFNGAGWNLGSGWLLSGTDVRMFTASGAGDLTQTNLAYNFSKGLSYDVGFTVAGYSSGSFDVKLYNGAVEVANLGSISASGSYSLSTGILTANCDTIKFEPGSGAQQYNLDSVTALINIEDSSYAYRTDCFQLLSSHDCTVKLSGTNLDNAFGIDFLGLSYNPVIRVTGELEIPKYDGDKENEEDSAGISKTLYFKSEKKRDLFIWQQPEYIHDFIRLLIGYDTFKVDDVDYVASDPSYSPEGERLAGKLTDLTNASSEVRLKTDLNENKYC